MVRHLNFNRQWDRLKGFTDLTLKQNIDNLTQFVLTIKNLKLWLHHLKTLIIH